jgi:hypothetical protein
MTSGVGVGDLTAVDEDRDRRLPAGQCSRDVADPRRLVTPLVAGHEDEEGVVRLERGGVGGNGLASGNLHGARRGDPDEGELGAGRRAGLADQAHHTGVGAAVDHDGAVPCDRWYEAAAHNGADGAEVVVAHALGAADDHDDGASGIETGRAKRVGDLVDMIDVEQGRGGAADVLAHTIFLSVGRYRASA